MCSYSSLGLRYVVCAGCVHRACSPCCDRVLCGDVFMRSIRSEELQLADQRRRLDALKQDQILAELRAHEASQKSFQSSAHDVQLAAIRRLDDELVAKRAQREAEHKRAVGDALCRAARAELADAAHPPEISRDNDVAATAHVPLHTSSAHVLPQRAEQLSHTAMSAAVPSHAHVAWRMQSHNGDDASESNSASALARGPDTSHRHAAAPFRHRGVAQDARDEDDAAVTFSVPSEADTLHAPSDDERARVHAWAGVRDDADVINDTARAAAVAMGVAEMRGALRCTTTGGEHGQTAVAAVAAPTATSSLVDSGLAATVLGRSGNSTRASSFARGNDSGLPLSRIEALTGDFSRSRIEVR